MLWRSKMIKAFATATTLCGPGTINIGRAMIWCYCDRPMLWKLQEKQRWIGSQSQQETDAIH